MAKDPKAVPRKIPVDMKLLSKEQREALTKEARASVLAEMEQAARDDFFKKEMARVRRDQIPEERLLHVMVDLPFGGRDGSWIMLDGVQYFSGYAYDVPTSAAAVIYEQMQRAWQHQDEIDGRRRSEAYRRPQNRTIGPQHAGAATPGFSSRQTVELPADTEI